MKPLPDCRPFWTCCLFLRRFGANVEQGFAVILNHKASIIYAFLNFCTNNDHNFRIGQGLTPSNLVLHPQTSRL